MRVEKIFSVIRELGSGNFYTGVPDSLLSPLIDGIVDRYGISDQHIVAANEGAAAGLAAGYYLATGQPAVVYMQNSGIGNAINPICSLLHKKIYAVPVIFIIGWRGEPGIKDEPQHIFQGEVTLPLLKCLEIPYTIVSKDTEDLSDTVKIFKTHIQEGQSVAFVICKDALQNDTKVEYVSDFTLSREDALKTILGTMDNDTVYVCSTGKLSREVFEIREQQGLGHERDFLTVGSMGHSVMIAHGIALAKREKRIICLDGDGALLMHMGSLAVIGAHGPSNLVYVVINNGAHETVGGIPAVSTHIDLHKMAHTLGFKHTYRAAGNAGLTDILSVLKTLEGPIFIEILCNLASRSDLGRPTAAPVQNKNDLMAFLSGEVI